jgi:hypothetical protein
MHWWECGMQLCEHCSVYTALPFDCLVINSDHPVKLWVWDKAIGDNARTMKVEKKMRDVFQELRNSLISFSQHSIALQLFNRQRYLNLKNLDECRAQVCTDFSSQLNLEPIRKVRSDDLVIIACPFVLLFQSHPIFLPFLIIIYSLLVGY